MKGNMLHTNFMYAEYGMIAIEEHISDCMAISQKSHKSNYLSSTLVVADKTGIDRHYYRYYSVL